MIFTYVCRNKTGALENGRLEASDRADAIARLRLKGITVVKIEVASKGNENVNKAKISRTTIVLCGIACSITIAIMVTFVGLGGSKQKIAIKDSNVKLQKIVKPKAHTTPVDKVKHIQPAPSHSTVTNTISGDNKPLAPVVRQQIHDSKDADPDVERGRRGGKPLFKHQSESFLALYAEPGKLNPPLPMTPRMEQDFLESLDVPITVDMNVDSEKDIRMKQIVAGMKEELKQYLAAGGTLKEYMRELDNRQRKEAGIRNETMKFVNQAALGDDPELAYRLWQESNKKLDEMGIARIPLHGRLIKHFGKQVLEQNAK